MNKSSPIKEKSSNSGVFRAPRNKVANKAYHENLGKYLAAEKVWELKSSRYGNFNQFDRYSDTVELPAKEGYKNTERKEVYKKSLDLYNNNELVRPIINLIASAIFSGGISNGRTIDIVGSNKSLVEMTKRIIDFNGINFHDFAREGELSGDVFLMFEPDGDQTKIFSLDAGSVDSVLDGGDIRRLSGFLLGRGVEERVQIPLNRSQQLKFNSTSTSQYGRSSIRHLLYLIDVLDSLFEKNWLRGAQYFGNPQLAITGVPGPYQQNVKNQMENQTQRAGRVLILPPDAKAETVDYSLGFPIGEIVAWVFRLISIGSEIPITLLGTADAGSRGSAFFANPRFTLAIKPKREVWRIGLRQLFIKIFNETGVLKKGEVPTREEFDFAFFPIFDKDFGDLADLVEVYRDRKLISARTAHRLMGFDTETEIENLEAEEELDVFDIGVEDPAADTSIPVVGSSESKHLKKEKRNKRRKKRNTNPDA